MRLAWDAEVGGGFSESAMLRPTLFQRTASRSAARMMVWMYQTVLGECPSCEAVWSTSLASHRSIAGDGFEPACRLVLPGLTW